MNKAEFISAVADEAGSSKSDASAHVEAMINVVTNALKSDNEVTLVGFGTFKAKNVTLGLVEILELANLFKLKHQQYHRLKLVKPLKTH